MPSPEFAPAPNTEMIDAPVERFPHFGIPGFEKLPKEAQDRYLKIPADKLDRVRPLIMSKIAEFSEGENDVDQGETEKAEGEREETTASNRETQTEEAIETFYRAENGDPEAKKDLLDQKKELLGEELTDDDIFNTILETNSSNPFAQDLTLEVMLSDEEAQAHQDVLDLFKEFRGDMASVDDALKPKMQIDLFLELTKGHGSLAEREHFARQALTMLTDRGHRNLRDGLKEFHVVDSGGILKEGVTKLRRTANSSEVKVEYA